MRIGKKPFFIALVPIVFFSGVTARIAGGNFVLLTDLAYVGGAAPVSERFISTGSPEQAAESFYVALAEGQYDRAWERSLEPDYSGGKEILYADRVTADPATFVGWTGKDAFLSRLSWELGGAGSLKLRNIRAIALSGKPEIPAYLSKQLGEASLSLVRVEGHMVGACTIFSWSKDVPVIGQDGAYRVLLDGTKEPKTLYCQAWFANLVKLGDLRKP